MKKTFICGEWMERATGQVFNGVAELRRGKVVKVHVPKVESGPVLQKHVRALYKKLKAANSL